MSVKKTSRRTAASPKRSPGPRRRSPITPKAAAPLLAFAALAKREHLRWYLFGAQAVAAHGVPRSTDDIDLTVELGERSLSELTGPLAKAGFQPLIADLAFAAETRVFPVHHRASGWNLDIVLAGPGIEETILSEVVRFRVGATEIPVISVENLVALKILAGRPRDLEDIRGLLRVAELDDTTVLRTLGALEAALDQSDLVPLFRRLRSESKR